MNIFGSRLSWPICLILAICPAIPLSAQVKPDGNAVLAGFEAKIDRGEAASVERDLFNFVIANPKDARGFSLLAKLRLKQRRFDEARALLNKASALDPKLVQAKVNLANLHLQLNETESALNILGQVVDTDVSDSGIRLAVAETYASAGDCVRALFWAEKLPLKLKNGSALAFRAGCYLESGNKKSFDELFLIAKNGARQNPSVAVRFAEVLGGKSLHREAATLLRQVVAFNPRNVPALLLLAASEIELNDFAKARARLSAAEKLDPRATEMLFVRAQLERREGNLAKSLEYLELSLSGDPNNAKALATYVLVAVKDGQNGKAFRAAERLITLQPDNLDFIYLHGIAALQSNNVQKAETSLSKYLDARPNDSAGCLAFGMALAAQPAKLSAARTQMEKCLAANPTNFEAAYQLGLSYKVEGDATKAIVYLERTVAISPNYAAALRDLGAAYLEAGEEKKARPVLEKSVAINPNDADAHFQLSRLYNLIGERELGKKHLEIFQRLKNPKKDGM
jgi:tetratricopeptide (TPR) repeat protein